MRWVLLPGLDGTGILFEPLKRAIANDPVDVIAYSPSEPLSYPALVEFVLAALPPEGDYLLLAESFSGPIGILAAAQARHPPRALALCASFAACPLSGMMKAIARIAAGFVFRRKPPKWFVRRYLLGNDVSPVMLTEFYRAIAMVSPAVLEHRLRSLLDVDVRASLERLPIPVLYIRGSKDRLVGIRGLRTVKECSPNLQVQSLEAPHLVLQRKPEESVAAVRRFMKSLH